MKIRFQVHALNEALEIASIVPPRPTVPEGGPGFLFAITGKECSIYSQDGRHQIRVKVPVEDADEDGSFIFPADKIGALKYLDGWIEIEAGKSDTEDRHWLKYEAESKDKQEDLSTIDPRMLKGLDDALQQTTEGPEFPAALLREALNTTKPYLAKTGDSRVEEHFQTLQLFDASKEEWKKGDGYVFAADGTRTCYFYCDKLKGKGLALHGLNLACVMGFLAKCQGNVRLRHGKNMTFLVNTNGQVLGWAHNVHSHGKFTYYAHKSESFVLKTDKDLILKALRYVRAALDGKRDKVRVQYNHQDKTLGVLASEGVSKAVSRPIPVDAVEEEGGAGKKGLTESFGANVNLNHLIELIEPMKAHRIELRVALVPAQSNRKEAALFRTIDSFVLDEDGKMLISEKDADEGKASQCQVTRFMPSRE